MNSFRFITAIAGAAALLAFATPTRAEVLHAKFLLEAKQRTMVIEHGGANKIRLDNDVYALTSVDSVGSGGRYCYNGERKTPIDETIIVNQETMTLGILQANPYMGAKQLGFRNADEVTCSRTDNAVLMIIRLSGAKSVTVGNCVRLERGSE